MPHWGLAAIGTGVVAAAAVVVAVVWYGDDGGTWQSADVRDQGSADSIYSSDAASIQRRADGISVELEIPTPEPGSYEYATNDMIPPWVEAHPPISQGAGGAPEAFTLWFFAFNDPERCTNGRCDTDDIGLDTAARGGVYQVDARIGDDDTLRFAGNVRLGQAQLDGSPLDDPTGAEVHLAVASHGRALSGADRVDQLNTPVGNPSLWWGASFPAR